MLKKYVQYQYVELIHRIHPFIYSFIQQRRVCYLPSMRLGNIDNAFQGSQNSRVGQRGRATDKQAEAYDKPQAGASSRKEKCRGH